MVRKRPRVLLVDDHALLLDAVETLLADECTVVGHVADGRGLLAAAQALKPDVIVLDIAMPSLNGLEAARQVKRALQDVKLVFLTMYEDPEVAAEAFRNGASAYLLKRSAATELSTAIRESLEGRLYVTPLISDKLLGSLLQGSKTPVRRLTPRQRGILELLAGGHSMKEVAAALKITPRTVAFHKYQMMAQLEVKSTAELIQYAMKHHIV